MATSDFYCRGILTPTARQLIGNALVAGNAELVRDLGEMYYGCEDDSLVTPDIYREVVRVNPDTGLPETSLALKPSLGKRCGQNLAPTFDALEVKPGEVQVYQCPKCACWHEGIKNVP